MSVLLLADIFAPSRRTAGDIAHIVTTCAQDVDAVVVTRLRAPRSLKGESVITRHMPAELAVQQHPAWCLACRLACFCPDARVGALVHSEAAFQSLLKRHRMRQSA